MNAFFTELDKVNKDVQALLVEGDKFDSFLTNKIIKIKQSATPISTKSVFDDFLKNTFDSVVKKVELWENQIKNNKDTFRFKKEFSDKFLIIVYGKVKAGKSTLGNYIAKSYVTESGNNAQFFKYDEAGKEREQAKLEEIKDESFDTRVVECTSTIQGFKAGGLVWIDTPGLGSMTDINGMKAKEYIESADLVIFPMSSDSPGRESDIKEIEEIVRNKGKSLLVVITKSDTTEEDEVDGAIVRKTIPKSKIDRQEQEHYVSQQLAAYKNSIINSQVISISTRLAEVNASGSNMNLFFSHLTEIMKNEGFALKRDEPIKRLRAIKSRLINKNDDLSFYALINVVENLESDVDVLESNFKEYIVSIKNKTISDCIISIEKIASREAINNTKDKNKLFETIREEVEKIIAANTTNVLSATFSDIISIASSLAISLEKINMEVKDIIVQETRSSIKIKTTWRSGTLFDNGLVNSVFGDPTKETTNYRTVDVKAGDNYIDLISDLKNGTQKSVISSMDALAKNINNSYFVKIRSYASNLKNEINLAISEINN